jgi:dihydrofolate reductase
VRQRRVIVHIAASADGYIARPDGDLAWLTSRPAPADFYGMNAFMKTIDTKVMGRKTYEDSLRLGATFHAKERTVVFSRQPAPRTLTPGVEFVGEPVAAFVARLRAQPGKDIWLMGGSEVIASFLDADAVDEFVVSVVPVFIGDGIPLLERRHRHLPLRLEETRTFDDGIVQLRYGCKSEGA